MMSRAHVARTGLDFGIKFVNSQKGEEEKRGGEWNVMEWQLALVSQNSRFCGNRKCIYIDERWREIKRERKQVKPRPPTRCSRLNGAPHYIENTLIQFPIWNENWKLMNSFESLISILPFKVAVQSKYYIQLKVEKRIYFQIPRKIFNIEISARGF